jgi:hypothetical protein
MHLGRSFRIVPSELRVPNFCACTAIALRWPANSHPATIGIRPEFNSSGSGAVIVVQHAAQPLAALDLTGVAEMARLWTDELVRQALVIAFIVIVGDEVLNGCPQRLLSVTNSGSAHPGALINEENSPIIFSCLPHERTSEVGRRNQSRIRYQERALRGKGRWADALVLRALIEQMAPL